MTVDHQHVTRLVESAAAGDCTAAEQLLPLVYAQLRAAAQQHLASENPGHTLQATALVHEAYIRLIGPGRSPGRIVHTAQTMRRILVDHARARGARGGKPIQLSAIPDVETLAMAKPEESWQSMTP